MELNGRRQSLVDWAKELGMNYDTLRYRYHRGLMGKEVEKIQENNIVLEKIEEVLVVQEPIVEKVIPSVGVLPVTGRICTKKTEKVQKEKKPRRPMTDEEKKYLSDMWKGKPEPADLGAKISAGKTQYRAVIEGQEYTLRELSEKYGIQYKTLSYRYRQGLRGRDLIVDRVCRDMLEYLDHDKFGRLISKKQKEVA